MSTDRTVAGVEAIRAVRRERYAALLAELRVAEFEAGRLKSLAAIARVKVLDQEVKAAFRQVRPFAGIGNR